ncbi:matrixin family metalloprotease [Pseudahrensia aquimaris]|uniref:Matrixin family metalloprotease n=1 Tax=Pseudahrensia aquimaris TaxID=744461 RepID=A0ABW3FEF9_9HYPH
MPNYAGTRWTDADGTSSGAFAGFDGTNGGSAGVVTWSIVEPGLSNQTLDPGFFFGQTVSFASVTPPNYAEILREAFGAWSAYGDIEFIQIEDQGDDFGRGEHATIRIGAASQGGPGGIYAQAFQPLTGMGGDVVFDSQDFLNLQLLDFDFFRIVATHEIGHALGLAHISPSITTAIMNSSLRLANGADLKADDIEGIQALYGEQDFAAETFYMPDDMDEIVLQHSGVDLTVEGNSSANTIDATALSGNETLMGHAGNDVLLAGTGENMLVGGTGKDQLDGGLGSDVMIGGEGNDQYWVDDEGDDVVEGDGAGYDAVWASVSNYTLPDHVERLRFTEGGDNTGRGNGLDNILNGNAGNDRFLADEGGADIFSGGLGLDVFDARNASEGLHLNLQNQSLNAGSADQDLFASIEIFVGSADYADTMLAGAGRVRFSGSGGDDYLSGGDEVDYLRGDGGNDTLVGGAGADALMGGQGDDHLYGGQGPDQFRFVDANFGHDTIHDFEDGLDSIRIHSTIATQISDVTISDNGTSLAMLTLNGDSALTISVLGLNGSIVFLDEQDFLFY